MAFMGGSNGTKVRGGSIARRAVRVAGSQPIAGEAIQPVAPPRLCVQLRLVKRKGLRG